MFLAVTEIAKLQTALPGNSQQISDSNNSPMTWPPVLFLHLFVGWLTAFMQDLSQIKNPAFLYVRSSSFVKHVLKALPMEAHLFSENICIVEK